MRDHRYPGEILRCSTDHGRTSDIDLLHCIFFAHVRVFNGLGEWIEVTDYQINPGYMVLLCIFGVPVTLS